MAVGDVLQLTRMVEIDGAAHQNVINFLNEGYTGSDEKADLALQWDHPTALCCEGVFNAAQNGATSVIKIGIRIQTIWPTTSDAVFFAMRTRALPALSQPLPTFCAIVHNISTGLAARTRRGRFFMGGISEGQTEGNFLASSGIALHENINDEFEESFMLGGARYQGFQVGVWSRKLNEFTPAENITTTPLIATIRRRKLGRGI